ncbi:MAG TPA: porin [Phycisphaerae bacterium]|nr:porin [Phycisphaerae bacterium]
MYRLVTGKSLALGLLACILLASSVAVADTEADLKAKIASLEQQVAAMRTRDTEAVLAMQAEETRTVVREMATDAAEHAEFDIVWRNGVWIVSGDRFAAHVGGRVYADWGWVNADAIKQNDGVRWWVPSPAAGVWNSYNNHTSIRDGSEFRTVRLLAEGTLYKYIQYKVELGWDGDTVRMYDAYMQMIDVPFIGNIQVGHFKEPFSLEEQTDSLFGTFMERSLGNVLSPGRNPGIMIHDAILGEEGQERLSWAIGMFRTEEVGQLQNAPRDGMLISSDGGYALSMRVTALPWYADGGEKLAHVGFAYSVRTPPHDTRYGLGEMVRYAARPEAHFLRFHVLDTGVIGLPVVGMSDGVDNVNSFGAEAALVYGPFSMQMEYIGVKLDTGDMVWGHAQRFQENPCFNAFYVEASYFITGEHRVYDHERGAFKRVSPKKNFREDGGWGAVQVATRYSYLDLDAEYAEFLPYSGTGMGGHGECHNWTMGVNWLLNPNVRLMANYIRSCPDRNDTANALDIFMVRFQWDF